MYQLKDNEDLRCEIFHLKKKLATINSENHLLKVKIRKLQNEIVRKDRQIDVVLDPRKTIDISKIMYERSATFVLNMKDKNDELLQLLQEKDIIIRRLQNQLDITKLYSQAPKKHFFQNKCADQSELENKIRQIQLNIPSTNNEEVGISTKKKLNSPLTWTSDSQTVDSSLINNVNGENSARKNKKLSNNSYDIKEQYKSLSRDQLLSIIENLKNNQRYSPNSQQTSSRKSSPESDLERIELLCESPHEEIQQLHLHFLDMITEVDYLKNTIAELQMYQEKTDNVLKKKNSNLDMLAKEIKNLKRPNSKLNKNHNYKSLNNTDLVTRLYSNAGKNKINQYSEEKRPNTTNMYNKNKKCNKTSNKSRHKEKSPNKKLRKDVMVQVDPVDNEDCFNQCTYIEKNNIVITQKQSSTPTSKEDEYDNEVFEECDEEESVN